MEMNAMHAACVVEKPNEVSSVGIPTGRYEDHWSNYENAVRIRGS
jgi:hypothetical protein